MSNNKVVLITGGTGDIGSAVCKQLASSFAHVVALDLLEPKKGQIWLDEIRELGYYNIHFKHLDVTNFDQCKEVVDSIIYEHDRVDALINNAGITRDAVFSKMT